MRADAALAHAPTKANPQFHIIQLQQKETEMVVVSLPIEDRRRAHEFYASTFRVKAIGQAASDGIAEPLRFDIHGTSILLIPTGGFSWALGDLEMTDNNTVGCLLTCVVSDDAGVDELASRADVNGGTLVLPPSKQPWGIYAATFTDPDGNLWMATSAPPTE